MIDIHSHILPGLDDGSQGWDESLEMARAAVTDGVHTLVATPHYDHPNYGADRARVESTLEDLKRRLREAGIALTVLPGGELTLSPHTAERLASGDLPMLANGPYFLLELCDPIPRGLDEELFQHRLAGRQPILTHVEREQTFQRSPEMLHRLVSQGALCQINAESLLGRAGAAAEKSARLFLAQRMVHFIASDAHGMKHRPPGLARALDVATAVLGSAVEAEALVLQNPQHVIDGRTIDLDPPRDFKRSWLSQLRSGISGR